MTNVDGIVTETERATIPVSDRGFLYGDSVYDVFRTYSGVPLFFDEHWKRLENSAALIHMDLAMSQQTMREEIYRTITATGAVELAQDVYVRFAVSRGDGPLSLYPDPDLRRRYVITVKDVPQWSQHYRRHGVALAVTDVRRNPPAALNPSIKGGNYLNNVLAAIDAHDKSADDGVLLSEDGLVTEATNSNIFFVLDDELVTPCAGNLNGLTKQAVQRSCAKHGVSIRECDIHEDDLKDASECFLTSATREVMPVSHLRLSADAIVAFPPGGGELTRAAKRYYDEYVGEYVASHRDESIFNTAHGSTLRTS